MKTMDVSIILVNYKGTDLTVAAVESIRQFSPSSEIILVDNASGDGSVDRLRARFRNVKVLEMETNAGFGKANNAGAAASTGGHLFFLNNDALLLSDSPAHLSSVLAKREHAGIVGPKLVYADRSFQMSFGFDPSPWSEWRMKRMQEHVRGKVPGAVRRIESKWSSLSSVHWVTGAALMIKREVFEAVGGFDESYFMYFEDADLCRRVKGRGWEVLYDPSATIVHFGGASVSSNDERIRVEYRKSQMRYYRKHASPVSNFILRAYLSLSYGVRWLLEVGRGGEHRQVYTDILRHVCRF